MATKHYLILLMGVPGSGKSTIAEQIIQRVNWVYLDNNFIIDPFFPDTRDSSDHIRLRSKFYDVLYNIAAHNLRLRNTVLLDAPHVKPMRDPEWWKRMHRLAKDAGADLRIVRCYCTEAVLKERIEGRNERRDAAKLEDWENFLREEPIRAVIPHDHLEINTETRGDASESVLRYVTGGDVSGLPLKGGVQ